MKRKQYDGWIEKLNGCGALRIGNLATIKEFDEVLQIFHPRLREEWDALNYWEKLRIVEYIVKGSSKIMTTQ